MIDQYLFRAKMTHIDVIQFVIFSCYTALTEDEIVAQAAVFILAGYDTVSTATSFLMFCLANNQDCQDRVFQEIQDVFGDGVG